LIFDFEFGSTALSLINDQINNHKIADQKSRIKNS